jgi:WD40-like Beta Propeller Repeat
MREDEFSAWLRWGTEAAGTGSNPLPAAAVRRRGDRRRRRKAVLSGMLVLAIGASGGGVAYAGYSRPAGDGPAAAGASTLPSAAASAQAAPGRPEIVAVSTAGALEVLDATSGIVTATLVPSGVAGDEIAVSSSGTTVYFAERNGCGTEIESVPVDGGKPSFLYWGTLPAISPDGTSLAFAYSPSDQCEHAVGAPGYQYEVIVRTLATGWDVYYQVPPQLSAQAHPVTHLSWAPDGKSLLLSIGAGAGAGTGSGTEAGSGAGAGRGWSLVKMPVTPVSAAGHYYLPSSWPGGGDVVPVTGVAGSYYREGVYLPDGDLFVNKVCCGGQPATATATSTVTSTVLDEIGPSGNLIKQVAVGYTNRIHSSLDASGPWLLYLSGHDLYVSDNGAAPIAFTSSLIAAVWVPA